MSNPYGSFSAPTTTSSSPTSTSSSPTATSKTTILKHLIIRSIPLPSSLRRGKAPLTRTQKILTALFSLAATLTLASTLLPTCDSLPSLPTVISLSLLSLAHVSYGLILYTAPFEMEDSIYYLVSSRGQHQLTKKWRNYIVVGAVISIVSLPASTYVLSTSFSDCPSSPSNIANLSSTIIVYASLVVWGGCVFKAYVMSIDAVYGSEGSVLLRWVRCSCCPHPLKKSLSLLPFLSLSVAGIIATADAWSYDCDAPLHEFTIASSCNILAYAMIGSFLFTRKDRKLSKAILCLIIAACISGFTVSFVGILYISSSSSCSVATPTLYYTSLALKSTLLGTTVFVTFFVACCKVETCLTRDDEGLKPINEVWVSRLKGIKPTKGKGDVDAVNNLEKL